MTEISKGLFERCCRASCTANGFDPDQIVPGHGWGVHDDDGRTQRRWMWVAEVCGIEIAEIIKITLQDALGGRPSTYVQELRRQRDRLLRKAA